MVFAILIVSNTTRASARGHAILHAPEMNAIQLVRNMCLVTKIAPTMIRLHAVRDAIAETVAELALRYTEIHRQQ
jgi:hypothetical protein